MITTSIQVQETPLVRFLLSRGDDALILGHRLSEWTGHAPILEEELALANMGLDLIGQARAYYDAAAEAEGAGHAQDDFAYLRDVQDFRCLLLVALPRGDFAFTMARQFLYAAAQEHWLAAAKSSRFAPLAAIAAKAEKENAYHLRHSAEWLIRLGDGTDESHRRAQDALDALWPHTGEMFEPDDVAIAPIPDRALWLASVAPVIVRATLAQPRDGWMQSGGRHGRHGEHLGHLLADMQHIARSHPGATW